MAVARHDIVIEKGATLKLPLRLRDSLGAVLNLTGFSARMQVRETADSSTAVLDLTTENGKITIDPLVGLVLVKGPASETDALTIASGVYDLELVSPGGDVDRLLEGRAKIRPNVTR